MPSLSLGLSLRGQLSNTVFNPSKLFTASEVGVWYDLSDLSTLFQDSAGTTPVTAAGQPVGKMLDKSGNNLHATQATSTQRPIYGINPIVGTRNLFTYTEQLENAVWTKASSSVSTNATTAPNGTNTADKLIEAVSGVVFHCTQQTGGTVGSTETFSVYIKAAERSWAALQMGNASLAYFNLGTGVLGTVSGGTASITSAGDGWYRCSISGTRTVGSTNYIYLTTGNNGGSYAGDGTSGLYVWGAQLESGSSATAYQRVGSQYDVTQDGIQSVGYLAFDGVDDNMVTGTITPATDKSQMFVGLRKLSDAAKAVVTELSTTSVTNNGSLTLLAPGSVSATNYVFSSRGTVTSTATATPYTAPLTSVVTTIGDIAADTATLRINGTVAATSATDQGTGNYLAYILYIGSRAGTGSFFNGRLYGKILRFGSTLNIGQIASAESWINSKTGAY